MKPPKELSKKHQKQLAFAAAGIFILFTALVIWFIGKPMLHFASEPERFRLWVDQHSWTGQLAYLGMVALQVVVALIPGEPLEIAGGYAFGALEGTLLCLAGGALGSCLVFGLVRRFGLPLVEVFFPRQKLQSLRFLQLNSRRAVLFLLIFMIPGTPKDLLCYYGALTNVRLPVLILICSLGRLPSVVTSTVGGDALGTRSYLFAVAVFAATFLISATGLAIYQWLCKKHAALHSGELTDCSPSDSLKKK